MAEPLSDHAPARRSSTAGGGTRYVLGGVFALVVGVGAIVLQYSYKLDAATVLTGGVYLKEGPRQALLLAGVVIAALGVAVTIVGVSNSARSSGQQALFAVTLTLAALTIPYGAIVLAGLAEKRGQQSAPAGDSGAPPPPPPNPAPKPPPEPEPLTPEGEASGRRDVVCGQEGCREGDIPVYRIEGGDGCVRDGMPAEWATRGNGTFQCEPYIIVPPGPTEPADATAAVGCTAAGCFQLSLKVQRPTEGQTCHDGEGSGTWMRTERVTDAAGSVYRCLGDI